MLVLDKQKYKELPAPSPMPPLATPRLSFCAKSATSFQWIIFAHFSSCKPLSKHCSYHRLKLHDCRSGQAGGTTPLKHAKSMPLRSGPKSVEQEGEHQKPVYRGKGPLKTSDLVYVEQIPGMLDIDRSTYANPSRPGFHSSYLDLLNRFPSPPSSLPVPPHNPLRSVATNNSNATAYVVDHPTHCPPAGREATLQRSASASSFSYPTSIAYKSLNQPRGRQCRDFPAGPIAIDEEQESGFQEKPPVLGSVAPRRSRRFLSQSHDSAHSPAVPQSLRPCKNHPNPSFSHPAAQGCQSTLGKPSSISLQSRNPSRAGRGQ